MPKFLFDHGGRRYELYEQEKHGRWDRGYPVDELAKEIAEQRGRETEVPLTIQSTEPSITLEKDLQEYLSRDLNRLEEGFRIYSEQGRGGREFHTDVGEIDILALDKEDNFVVIELKVGKAKDSVMGQLLGYMQYVRENLAKGKKVRGIIIAEDFDDRVLYAIRALPNVAIKKYAVKFEFQDVEI